MVAIGNRTSTDEGSHDAAIAHPDDAASGGDQPRGHRVVARALHASPRSSSNRSKLLDNLIENPGKKGVSP